MTLHRLLACALALGLALPTSAQAPLAPTSPAAHADDAPDEGIHVSGAWTITVREPDGTLVDRREFYNALVPQGAETLATLLTSGASTGNWSVDVTNQSGSASPAPCAGTADPQQTCLLIEPGVIPDPNERIFPNLTVDTQNGQIVLAGSLTVLTGGSSIDRVYTRVTTCDSSVSADDCDFSQGGLPMDFTNKVLDTALTNLDTGQIVSVEVVIGFN